MSAINEAYRVLGDDLRRAAYDRQLTRVDTVVDPSSWRAPPGAPPHATAPPAPGPPARMPWKLMGGMVVVGIAVVLTGVALREPAPDRPADGVLDRGSCVAIEPNGDAREVNCGGEADLLVERVVAFDTRCPPGTEPHRDRQGLGIACVTRAAAP